MKKSGFFVVNKFVTNSIRLKTIFVSIMRKCWLSLIFALSVSVSFGQIYFFDADALARDTTLSENQLRGAVTMNYDISKQQNRVRYFRSSVNLAKTVDSNLLVVRIYNTVTDNGTQSIQNTGNAQIRFLNQYAQKGYMEWFGEFQWDAARGLGSRFAAGANYRRTVINKNNHYFFTAIGLFTEAESWTWVNVPVEDRPIDPQIVNTEYIKLNAYLKYHQKIENKLKLTLISVLQTRLDSYFSQPRISFIGSLNYDISSHFALQTTYNGMYDFAPVVPVPNYYYSWYNSIVFKF